MWVNSPEVLRDWPNLVQNIGFQISKPNSSHCYSCLLGWGSFIFPPCATYGTTRWTILNNVQRNVSSWMDKLLFRVSSQNVCVWNQKRKMTLWRWNTKFIHTKFNDVSFLTPALKTRQTTCSGPVITSTSKKNMSAKMPRGGEQIDISPWSMGTH